MRFAPVSVVIPAFRAARTIGRAVSSALSQTVAPEEVIVVDDGSPDWAAEEAEVAPYRHAVTVIRKANGGVASARNAGVDAASKEWVAFLDSDDYWEPARIERQLAVVRGHPSLGLVASHWWEEWHQSRRKLVMGDPRLAGRQLLHPEDNAFRTALSVWTGTVLAQRSLLAERRFDGSVTPAEDRDMWCALAASAPCYIVGEPLATYVQSSGSLSNSDVDRDCGAMLKVVRRHGQLLSPREVKRQTAVVYRRWASGHLSRRQPRRALRPALRRLHLEPLSAQAWWIVAKAAGLSLVRGSTSQG